MLKKSTRVGHGVRPLALTVSDTRIVIVASLLLGALLLALIPISAHAQNSSPRVVTFSEVTDNTDAYIGQTVTVRGDLVEVIGTNAFRLEEDGFFGGDSLLVVGANEGTVPFSAGGYENAVASNVNMQVTGVVRRFNVVDVDNEVGYDLDDDLFTEFAGQAAIVASNVQVIATLNDVADNTAAYLGLPVTVYGDITDVVSPTAFRLDDAATLGADTLLIVAANANVIPSGNNLFNPGVFDTFSPSVSALVTGVVRSPDITEVEREVGYDLDDALFTDYAEDGVIVASSVTVDASLSDVADNPEALSGLTVTVQGDVIDRVGPNAFQLDDEALLGADTVLVVNANPNQAFISGGARVTGTVRTFNLVDIENELGYALDEALFADYEGRATIVARSVVPVQ